jgi:hypothetical protein
MLRCACALMLGWITICSLHAYDYSELSTPIASRVYGTVKVIMPGGAQRPLKTEEPVPIGAKIDTDEKGEVLIALQPGMVVKLGINTRAYINTWKMEPTVNRQKPTAGKKPTVLPPVNVVLTRGTICAALTSDAYLERTLIISTKLGTMTSTSGSFAVTQLLDSVDLTTLHGSLFIDTWVDKELPIAKHQITLGPARHLNIPRTRDVTGVGLIGAGDPLKTFSAAALTIMEGITHGVLPQNTLEIMAKDLAAVGKAGDVQVPVIINIGQQLAGFVLAGRISPSTAGAFIKDARGQGLAVGNETLNAIEQAIANAPPPILPKPPANPLMVEGEVTPVAPVAPATKVPPSPP